MDETEKRLKSNIFVIYLLGFLFTLHASLPVFISSTYLSHFATEKFVGLIYVISSILTICVFAAITGILRKFGNYKTVFTLLIIEFFALLGLAFFQNNFLISVLFIVNFTATAIVGFNLDIFLERFSSDAITGKIRGTLLSTSNIAWIVSPLIVSFVMTDSDYWKVFIAAALLLIPIFFLLNNSLKDFKDPEYMPAPIVNTLREILLNKNILGVLAVGFLLQFFYSWMVIYTPIYLYTYMGFTWREIGVMFSIMLLPFVLTEAPLGRLADKRWGEKEVMSIGFIVMAISAGLISFIQSKNMLLWTAVLFVSRIGAAMVEIMSETYFFKKVDSTNSNIIGVFRTMRPWAYVISPILATILFFLQLPIKYIFIILGVIMFLGLHWSLKLEDTK